MASGEEADDYAIWNEMVDLFLRAEEGFSALSMSSSAWLLSSPLTEAGAAAAAAAGNIRRYIAFAHEVGDTRSAARTASLAASCPACVSHRGEAAADHTCIPASMLPVMLQIASADVIGFDEFNHTTGWRWALPPAQIWTAAAPIPECTCTTIPCDCFPESRCTECRSMCPKWLDGKKGVCVTCDIAAPYAAVHPAHADTKEEE